MALKRNERYPGRFDNPSTAHPQGAFKNRTAPSAQDGSYLEADWANDWDGFFARLLNVAGVTPNGSVDTGSSSQLYDALLAAMPGRLLGIPKRFVANGTYTPTPGTKMIMVEVLGAGGGGGNASASTTSAIGVGTGGGSGAYAQSFLTVVPTSQSVTVGAGGVGGAAGGASSFGSIVANGGLSGGNDLSATNTGIVTLQRGPNSSTSSGGTHINAPGAPGGDSLITRFGNSLSGKGGDSQYSKGPAGVGGSSAAGLNALLGAGGSGANATGTTSVLSGGTGGDGLVIVWEFA